MKKPHLLEWHSCLSLEIQLLCIELIFEIIIKLKRYLKKETKWKVFQNVDKKMNYSKIPWISSVIK